MVGQQYPMNLLGAGSARNLSGEEWWLVVVSFFFSSLRRALGLPAPGEARFPRRTFSMMLRCGWRSFRHPRASGSGQAEQKRCPALCMEVTNPLLS